MPGKTEDLRHAETGDSPDLTFGYNELMEELKAEFSYPEREPGDVTAQDMADATGLSRNWCTTQLGKKVRAGELVRIRVKGRGVAQPYYVYRRKKELQ